MKINVSNGLKIRKISEIADVNPGKSKVTIRNDMDRTSFIPMEAVDETLGTVTTEHERLYEEVKNGYTYFEEGDIIFAKITPCMQNGKSAIVGNLIGGFGFGSTEFIVIRAKPGISNKWLLNFLRTAEFRKDAEDHFTGSAGQQRVSSDFVSNHTIPYPTDTKVLEPLLIALDEKIKTSQKLREAAQKQKEAANALQDSILREVFPYKAGDKLPSGWKWKKLSLLSNNIQYGISIASTKNISCRKLLRITDIQKGQVNWDTVPYCDCNMEEAKKYELKDRDIVFARTGATTGKSFLVRNPENTVFDAIPNFV